MPSRSESDGVSLAFNGSLEHNISSSFVEPSPSISRSQAFPHNGSVKNGGSVQSLSKSVCDGLATNLQLSQTSPKPSDDASNNSISVNRNQFPDSAAVTWNLYFSYATEFVKLNCLGTSCVNNPSAIVSNTIQLAPSQPSKVQVFGLKA